MNRRQVAALLRDAITKNPRRELAFLRDSSVTVAAFRENIRHLALREDVLPDLSGRMSDKAISTLLDQVEAREIAKIMKLFRQVRRGLPQQRLRLNSVWYEPDALVKVDGEFEWAPRVCVSALRAPATNSGGLGACPGWHGINRSQS